MSWKTWQVAGRTGFVKTQLIEAEGVVDLGPLENLPAPERKRLLVGPTGNGQQAWYWQPAWAQVAFPLVKDGKPYSNNIKKLVARQGLQTQLDGLRKRGLDVLLQVKAGVPLRDILARPGVTFGLPEWLTVAKFDTVTIKPEDAIALLHAANGPGAVGMSTLWKVAGIAPAEGTAMQLPKHPEVNFVIGEATTFAGFLDLAERVGVKLEAMGLNMDNAQRDVAAVTRHGFKLKPDWKGGFDKDVLNAGIAEVAARLEKLGEMQALLKRASKGEWFFEPGGNSSLVNTCEAVHAGFVSGVTCYPTSTLALDLKTAANKRCFGLAYKLEGHTLIHHVDLWERLCRRQEVSFTTAAGATVQATFYASGEPEKKNIPLPNQQRMLSNIRQEFQGMGMDRARLDTLIDWYRKTLFG